MNTTEFQTWRADFGHHFPETQGWLEKQGPDTIRTWRDALTGCNLADAKEATARLHRGDGATIHGPSQYPAAIRELCRTIADERPKPPMMFGRWQGGEETYRCPLCRDCHAPTVNVLQNRHVKQAMAGVPWGEMTGPTNKPGVAIEAVACSCYRGEQYAERVKAFVYDPARMFLFPDGWPMRDEPPAFPDWLDVYKITRTRRRPNFEPAFDEFDNRKDFQ